MRRKNIIALITVAIIAGGSLGIIGILNFLPGSKKVIPDDTFKIMNWTWISGNKTTNVNGVYGIKGVPDEANCPGSRQAPLFWADSDDNFWLFGGLGYAESGGEGMLNDLWKFDGANWTWVSGNKTTGVNGMYGTKGVPNATNYLGGRALGNMWIDSDKNLWIFGGDGYAEAENGILNDLWKFDGANWTWVSGNKTTNAIGTYGMKGVSNITNHPGNRWGSVSWKDSNENLWLFGGIGNSEMGDEIFFNDLWKFNGQNWTWVSGNKTANINGMYGTKGVPGAANYPGSRGGANSWIDSFGNIWLFGGYGYSESGGESYLNDLWKFDGSNWTWVSGNKTANINGIYGIKGLSEGNNYPGSRAGAIFWIDSNENLWVFGGEGYGESGADNLLNDLWKFDGTSWTWMSGSKTGNIYGVYGIKGISDIQNYPGSRYVSCSWVDSNDNLWLFGGDGFSESLTGNLNDLWMYESKNYNH